MNDTELTELAKPYIGQPALGIAWFAGAIAAGYAFSVYAGISGVWPGWLAFAVASYLAFMSYTPLHESVHQNICGRDKKYRALNDAVGYVVASILGFSFHVHKWAHRMHHQHTNVVDRDPDHVFKGHAVFDAMFGGVLLVANEYRLYFRQVFPRLAPKDKAIVIAEISLFIGWRVLLGLWFPLEVLIYCVLTSVVGVTWLVIIFAWLVHIPFDETERFRDTSTYLLPGPVHRIGTYIWLWQNYHSIHHLFPRIPFYKYDDLFSQIEPGLRERGTPIYQL